MNIFRGLCLLLFLGGTLARAHVVEAIYTKFEVTGEQSWQATVFFDAGYALPEMRAETDAPQPKREWLVSMDEAGWQELRAGAEGYLRELLSIDQVDREGLTESLDWVMRFPDFDSDPPDFPVQMDGGAYMRIVISGELQEGQLQVRVAEGSYPRLTLGLGNDISVVAPGGWITVMKLDEGGIAEIENGGTFSRLMGLLWLGFNHVLPAGADHVLFILALFLYAPRWRPLLHQSIMFTVAHSLTLGLMLGGVVNANPVIIEPLIALSIAWVALEHLFLPDQLGRRRLAAVFGFGLIHGLGFASSLQSKIPVEGNWVMALVSANIGIELAQLSILAVCLLMFHRFIEETWFSRLRQVGAVLIGVTGLWWCVERAVLGG
ncbi:MAG: HupE/UreJ family protein [Akkermansiaceae bacterium]